MNGYQTLKTVLLMAVLVLMPLTGCADSDSQAHKRRMGPPPEAIQACAGKKAGDSVEFTGRRGETVKATCREINGQLAAAPVGGPPQDDRM
ncbi:MAG: hypothetical protein WBB19_13650 [Desulforhopalus sp.]